MTNGGSYSNVKTINGFSDIDSVKLRNILNKNEFIDIEFEHSKKALLRSDCISSINFEP
jgi:hypothetical protein